MSTILQNTGALTRSGHRLGNDTGTVQPLYHEEFTGDVQMRFVKTSFMRSYVELKSVTGTDTVTNDRMGKTSIQAVTPGIRPESHAPEFDNISVKVDTIILSRSNQFVLDDFQASYEVRGRIAEEQGKELGIQFDETIIGQAIKAAHIVIGTGAGETAAPEGFQSGTVVTLTTALDELDPDLLQRAIEDACQSIEEKDVDIEGAVILLRPAQFYTLLRNDKLISTDFSTGNGNYAAGQVLRSNGIRIVKTNRMPNAPVTGHLMSNPGNANAYDLTQLHADCVALIMMPKAVLAGQTIGMTSKIYYSDVEMQHFVDSYHSYGCTPNRAEHAAVVNKAAA
jgi:hypothetical protein